MNDLSRRVEAENGAHARIDHRDVDSGAGVPGRPERGRTDQRRRVEHRPWVRGGGIAACLELERRVWRDRLDGATRADPLNRRGRHFRGESVDDVEAYPDTSPARLDHPLGDV